MVEVMNDFEQMDAFKRWWQKNGRSLIIGIILAVVIILGWQFYQRHQASQIHQASFIYQELMIFDVENQQSQLKQQADLLIKDYPKTPYAALGQLFMAKTYVDQHQLPKAIAALQWNTKHSTVPGLTALSHIRLARIYIAQLQGLKALQELKSAPKGFEAYYEATRGDAYVQLKDWSRANRAYQKVLQLMGPDQPLTQLVKLKLSVLPVSQTSQGGHA